MRSATAMNRRSFLSLSSIATGSFLVPDEIARRTHESP